MYSKRLHSGKNMTIRTILLISYVLISLASALMISLMIFVHLQDTLKSEIEEKLKFQAVSTIQQIDTALFERMENMAMWSQLEIMQELRVRDIDKRLSHFLTKLHTGYDGVYEQIFVVDQRQQIVSSCDPALLGQTYNHVTPWLTTEQNQQVFFLQSLETPGDKMFLSIAINDAFVKGELGYLYAGFSWDEIFRLLDAPLPFGGATKSYVLLLDHTGRIIASSAAFRDKTPRFKELPTLLAALDKPTGSITLPVDFLDNEVTLVGYAHSLGYRTFKGFNWTVLILQPNASAFAPVRELWLAIVVFLCLTILLGVVVSFFMSAKIAKPIVQLAGFTREFMQGKQVAPPQLRSSLELVELSAQFNQMISNLEQSKHDLVRVAKLAVIGEMAASMAHEVRTPLGILQSSAQILQREQGLTEIGQEMTEFILSETQRLNGLVTMLLECAKPRASEFTQQHLPTLIEHTLELLSSQAEVKHVHITSQFTAQRSDVYCDRDQIIQVLLNLVMNALQHVECDGLIEVALTSHNETMEIVVSDNGEGITDANKSKVFEPFFTQRKEGIGLGLTVVQQIIFSHHGQIYVTDSPLGGASFHVVLPVQQILEL
jgi:two-component system sensor histidine kinase HydH